MNKLATSIALTAILAAEPATAQFVKTDKVSAELMAMVSEPISIRSAATSRKPAATSGEEVVIDTAASGDPEVLAADLRALGAKHVAVFGRIVSAVLPVAAIPALNGLRSLHLACTAPMITSAGAVTSQGDVAIRSDSARTAFGVDGAGVIVGTLSDSYNCLPSLRPYIPSAADGVASGDLPADSLIIREGPCNDEPVTPNSPISDEGRAMMEVIHDVAPGSRLAFHTSHFGQANFAQGILALADAGATIINDDTTYLHEPFYQEGVIAQAVDQVKARGVSYFSAAGNDGDEAMVYEVTFRPSGQIFDIGKGPSEAHDFDPGPGVDTCINFNVPAPYRVTVVYQWDQPFFSVSGPPGSASDMDMAISFMDCNVDPDLTFFHTENNIGGDPIESGRYSDVGGIRLLHVAGPAPGLMRVALSDQSAVFPGSRVSGCRVCRT